MALPLSSKMRSLELTSTFHPLTEKNFGILWVGAFLSNIGFWIQSVGQGWQVLQLTNSAFLLGLVIFAATVPNVVLSLFGGVITDRMNRRYLLLGTQTAYMTTAILLGILTTLHIITVWEIIGLALINGVFSSVGFPAWQAFIGELVRPDELRQGIALNSMQFNLSRVVGPAIGGFSVALFGLAGSYYLNALSYIAVIIPLLLLRPALQQRISQHHSIHDELRDGLGYVRQRPALQVALLLQFLIAFFVFPYATLLPVFARDIFHIGPQGLGLLNAVAGIGALLGSIFVVILSQRIKNGPRFLMILCIAGGSACLIFALSPTVWTALPLLVIMGACAVSASTVTNTTLQTMSPLDMRGRVLSIWVLITFGVAPFGNLVAGWVAQTIGTQPTLAWGGGICAVAALLVVFWRIQHRTVRA